jgi:glycosyltransferase involved in cell wall biosynthesis
VAWYPVLEFGERTRNLTFDVFVVSRYSGFFTVPIPADLKVLWNHDTLDRPEALKEVADRIDLFLVLSRFHRDHFLTRMPELEDRMVITRNGVDLDLIDRAAASAVRHPNKVIYASRPERGLMLLLEDIWPKLKRLHPDLTLHLCGYDVDPADLEPGLADLYRRLDDRIASSPDVIRLGSLTKSDYYRHLAEAALMLYPCVFPEISCIAALEAQAARTPILTTAGFALTETVPWPDLLTRGRPGGREYVSDYVDRAAGLLDDHAKRSELAENGRGWVESRHVWPVIAAEWDRLFDLQLTVKRRRRSLG